MASRSTMGQHRGGYLKSPSSPSSKLLPSSPTNRKSLNQKVTLPFNLKNSKNSVFRPHTNLLNISRPTKHQKMSSSSSPSKKRAHEDEPFEIDPSVPTGLEEVLAVPSKKRCLTASNPEREIYARRKRLAKYAAVIRQKKALASQTSQSLSRMPVKAQKGMRNPMSLCYRISLFQALFHQPKLVNFLLDSHTPEDCVNQDSEDKCLPCALHDLLQGYWKAASSLVDFRKVFQGIDGLFDALGWTSDVSSGHADPEEQLAWMFGAMRTAMPSSTFATLESLMEITTTSTIKCKCGHESRTEGHSDRALPVAITPKLPNGTLAQYLQKYMVEVIDGYKCEKCKDESEKNRVQLIEHGPDILAVQLKRFHWDGKKDSSIIGINPVLHLDMYRSDDNKQRLEYHLTAIIKHSGSAGFGHYICSAKSSDGAWYCFNDEKVLKSSLEDAMKGKGFTPYVLFYQRKEM